MKRKFQFSIPVFVLLVGLFIWSCEKSTSELDESPTPGITETLNQDENGKIANPVIVTDDIATRVKKAAERRSLLKKKSKNSLVVDDDGDQCPDARFMSIQDAVDSGAKIIHICEGTYAENVVIDSDVKLFGAGKDLTLVTGEAGTAGPIIDVTRPDIDVEIRNLTVDGNKVTRADLGIAIGDCQNAHVHNNYIVDSYYEGISIQFLGFYFGTIGKGAGIAYPKSTCK